MSLADLLIAALAILVGLAFLGGAILDATWLMQLPKTRLATDACGERATRICLSLLGIGMIVLGIVIASGWRMNWGNWG